MEETYVAQTLSTPKPPVVEKPKIPPKAKRIILIIAIVVMGFLFFSLAYVLNLQKVVKDFALTPTQTNTSKSSPTITPKPTSVPTTNWDTFTSSNGKYSLKYPSDGNWKVASTSAIQIQCLSNCPKAYNIYNFSVTKSDKTSLSQFIASLNITNNNIHPYIEDYKFIKIDGLDAVEILIAGDPGSGTGPTVEVFIVIDGVGYLYSYTYLDPSLNSVTDLDQLPDPNPNILTTLTIDGQTSTNTVTTSDWKDYANTTQGVTLKYPANWFVANDENVKTCTKFSDSSDFAPPHAHNVFTLCTYPDPVQGGDASSQITLNGYQGIRVKQLSTWGAGEKVFLSNPIGGSVALELLAGDTDTYNLILSTFRFTQ